MSLPDFGELMKQAQAMQGRVAALQRELAAERFEGAAGGGMVKAIVSGELRVLEIKIEPSLMAADDLAMVQDLTAAAVNAALANAQREVQEKLGSLTGGLGLPNLPGLGGPGGAG